MILARRFACVAAIFGAILSPDDAAAQVPGVLRLSDGGFASGELRDAAGPDAIRWQSPAFVGPFEFSIGVIDGVTWPSSTAPSRPSGASCFELSGGDVVFGSLVSLDEARAEIDSPRWGRLAIDRDRIRRISAWHDGTDLVYMGPSGLAGWQEPAGSKNWRDDAGQPATDKDGAALWADLKLPARAAIEVEISWKTRPDFLLALGVAADAKTIAQADLAAKAIRHAARLEVWDRDLVVVREAKAVGDVASLQELPEAALAGKAHLLIYLDQARGRVAIASTAGKILSDIQVDPAGAIAEGGVCLINKHGDVRLERLRVSRWIGALPSGETSDESRIDRADGTSLAGRLVRFDPGSREYIVLEKDREVRVPEDRAASLTFSRVKDEPAGRLRLVYQDGTRLGGDLIAVERGDIRIHAAGIAPMLTCRQQELRSLVSAIPPAGAPPKGENPGRLELDGLTLHGRLAEGDASAGLAWRPIGGANSCVLRPGASGRIVYKEPPPPAPAQAEPIQPQRGLLRNIFSALASNPQARPKAASRALHLRGGDVIPCEVTAIDEAGVSFKSPISDSTSVTHDKIKMVELADEFPGALKLNKSKKERLLTLPRVQKASPPTQMIRSKNGDYLRGRVLGLDDGTLRVEVRLDTKIVPRDRISRIIWLHPDELDAAKTPAVTSATPQDHRVQALRSDGIRLSFAPERLADATLSGRSEVLGSCRVRIADLEQILIGNAIEQEAAKLAAQQWKLKGAIEPKVASEEGGETSRGTESELVGKPAPDLHLLLLGGKDFHLAEQKGSVVILDFWATWCGPCLQAMPQVERVAREFEGQGVRLVAVNLMEEPSQIAPMMERHNLHPTVALDRDGVAAARYNANAIPQTVIVDGDGVVARLFVGAGPHFDDQLREALRAVLKADAARATELPRNLFAPGGGAPGR